MKILNSIFDILVGLNGLFLILGICGIATFLGILAILYAVFKLIPTE